MIHHTGINEHYHWGVSANALGNGIIVLVGNDTGYNETQSRAVLSVEQAEKMVYELIKNIYKLKEGSNYVG